MEKNVNIENIPAEKFQFAQLDAKIHDKKFETKPIGYMQDAWLRFKKNKASLVATAIIIAIVLFAFLAPLFSKYKISDADAIYGKARPKCNLFVGTGFWDGGLDKKLNDRFMAQYVGIAIAAEDHDGYTRVSWDEALASEYSPFISIEDTFEEGGVTYRWARMDSYDIVGFRYLQVTMDEYNNIKAWEKENNMQIIYPMVDVFSEYCDSYNQQDANFWYCHDAKNNPVDKEGKRLSMQKIMQSGLVDNYLRDENGNVVDYMKKDKNMVQIRVLYSHYYQYVNGHEPGHIFGADQQGYDIMVRMAHGTQLSLLLSIVVASLNLFIGAIYGSFEGYYGGILDLLLERLSDILNGVPFVIVATLFQLHLINTGKVSPFVGIMFAFVITGWIGIAYRVRTQFYRYKNQEYILAARTLGASDGRLMFKHIFPNTLGTLITSVSLIIPSTIMSESVLSYLGISSFNTKNMISLGTLLSNGKGALSTDPHILLIPSAIISLMMISFNLFSNGLRDAFNPSLRGADE